MIPYSLYDSLATLAQGPDIRGPKVEESQVQDVAEIMTVPLLQYSELPQWRKDNHLIVSGYR